MEHLSTFLRSRDHGTPLYLSSWIVMELVHGDTLHARIFTAPEASDILKWAGQLAAGMIT